ncbi:MAG TPA: hypothetical protein VGB19_05725 [Actinomycetota bacterium]
MATDQGQQARRSTVKRVLLGRRHATSQLPHTLLPKILALPIFSSDPLSSVAYATEQIMVVLLAASATSRHLVLPISLVIAAVLAIVVVSYRQTVRAYPSGGEIGRASARTTWERSPPWSPRRPSSSTTC